MKLRSLSLSFCYFIFNKELNLSSALFQDRFSIVGERDQILGEVNEKLSLTSKLLFIFDSIFDKTLLCSTALLGEIFSSIGVNKTYACQMFNRGFVKKSFSKLLY